jgi:hypothetical protein
MIGPIQFAPGLYCGSRPETVADREKLKGFVMIDLETRPVYGMCDYWFPLQSVLPPMRFRVAAVINALSMLSVTDERPKFLHCRTFRDRGPYIVAKYLIVKTGASRDYALCFIDQFKPHWWLAWWRLFI